MSGVLAIFGALGGLAAFGVAVVTIVKAIFRQVSATQANTKALNNVCEAVDRLDVTVTEQGERIARLEGNR